MRGQIKRPRQNSLIPASHRTYSGFTKSSSGWQESPGGHQYSNQPPMSSDWSNYQDRFHGNKGSVSDRMMTTPSTGNAFPMSNRCSLDRNGGENASANGSEADWYTIKHKAYRDTTSEIISLYGNGHTSISKVDKAIRQPTTKPWTPTIPRAIELDPRYKPAHNYNMEDPKHMEGVQSYSSEFKTQSCDFGANPYSDVYPTEHTACYPQTHQSNQVCYCLFHDLYINDCLLT